MEYSNLFVVLMGIGTVFVGLVCIIILCSIMSLLCRKFSADKKAEAPAHAAAPAPAQAPVAQEIPNRRKIIAVVSAVIAEELGEDVSAIKIKSFKKI